MPSRSQQPLAVVVAPLLLAGGAGAPTALGAQAEQAAVRVTARVGAPPPRLVVAPAPPALTAVGPPQAHGRAARPLAGGGPGEVEVRAAGAYRVLVLRGDSLAAPAATGSAAPPRVWVLDARGARHPLTSGQWLAIAAGPPGNSRAPALRYEADVADARGRVALVYEVRVEGETQ